MRLIILKKRDMKGLPLNPYTRIWVGGLVLCLMLAHAAFAGGDWTQWRGENRDGEADVTMPSEWPDALKRVWQVTVGEGHAGPLVLGDRVFVFARQGEQEVASCFDLQTGKKMWAQKYDAPYEMNSAARGHGKGPKSTPVLFFGRLYTLGIGGILSCFDAETGKVVWQHDFVDQFEGALPLYGTSMSPVVVNGMLVAHVGGHDNGALMAFDAKTGNVKWSWAQDGPAYTSPIVATLDGVQQVVTQTQVACVGVDVETGDVLWRIPFITAWDQNIVTPVVFDDLVIFSGLEKGTTAYRPVKGDGGWTAKQVWQNDDVSMYMNSPVLIDGVLYGLAHTQKGHFFALDVKSGKLLWQSKGRQSDQVLMAYVDGMVLNQKENGTLMVMRASKKGFKPVAEYEVADSPTWAPPAVIDNHVIVKDKTDMILWRVAD